MLGQILHEAEEAPLGVEPGVGAELLVVRLQGLDHATDAELVVALGAVQGPDHQVDDAEVEHLPVRVLVSQLLLLLLNLPHELLRLLVLRGHDVAHTQVGQHYGGHVQDRVKVLLHNWLVETCGFFEFILLKIKESGKDLPVFCVHLHEEDVSHI